MKKSAGCASPNLGVWVSVLVFSILGSCSRPKPPVFKGVNQLRIEDVDMDSATIFAELVFSNPNAMQLDFKKLDCQVFADNHLVGHYRQDSLTHVLPSTDFTYPARIRVGMKPIVQNAVASFLSGSVDLHLVGTVKVGRGGFFANVPIDFSHRQKLQF